MRTRLLLPLAATACLLACAQPPAPPTPLAAAGTPAVNLAPPPAGEGVQLTIGPFAVPPGAEVQKNFFLKLPVDQDVAVNRIQISYPRGSHHCNVFKTDKHDAPDHVEDTFDAVPYELFDMFAASQSGDLDWALPPDVVVRLKKRQQLIVQTHWVNANTQKTPGDQGLVKINLWFAKDAARAVNLGMLFAINKNLDIPPKSTREETKLIDLRRSGFNEDVKILAMTGHFHSRGRSFTIDRLKDNQPVERLYQSENWDEPPFKTYDPPLELKAGEQLRYTSQFVNDTDRVIKFGPHVEWEEHSNLFMYFYPGPADGRAVYDTDGAP